MKYLLTVVLVIYLVSGLLFPRAGMEQEIGNPDNLSGEYVLVKGLPLRVSIDTGWERGEKIPVFLVFSDLEVVLEVSNENLSQAVNAENCISEMLTADRSLSFVSYEKNPLRTRMELMDKSKPIKFHIDGEKGVVDFYVGDSRLKLESIDIKLASIGPGDLYELTFIGPNVHVLHRGKLVFVPSKSMIYNVSHNNMITDIPTELGKNTGWNEWAVRIEPGNGKYINQGE